MSKSDLISNTGSNCKYVLCKEKCSPLDSMETLFPLSGISSWWRGDANWLELEQEKQYGWQGAHFSSASSSNTDTGHFLKRQYCSSACTGNTDTGHFLRGNMDGRGITLAQLALATQIQDIS
jgi:hypothetical protein